MTANPWPSSDWIAFISERGFIPAIALLTFFVILFFSAFRRWAWLDDSELVLARLVLGGTIAATIIVGMFDASLLLAAPALLAWSALGASSGAGRRRRLEYLPASQWRWAVVAMFALSALAIARSSTQIAASL